MMLAASIVIDPLLALLPAPPDATGRGLWALVTVVVLSHRRQVSGEISSASTISPSAVRPNSILKSTSVMPVSYTHLDVYKRQLYKSYRPAMPSYLFAKVA